MSTIITLLLAPASDRPSGNSCLNSAASDLSPPEQVIMSRKSNKRVRTRMMIKKTRRMGKKKMTMKPMIFQKICPPLPRPRSAA